MRTVKATVTVSIWDDDDCRFECTAVEEVTPASVPADDASLHIDVEVAVGGAAMSVETAIAATHGV